MIFALRLQKGAWGEGQKFNTKFVKKMLEDNNLHPDFSAWELLKVWEKG